MSAPLDEKGWKAAKALRRYGPIEIDSLLEVVGMPRVAGKP